MTDAREARLAVERRAFAKKLSKIVARNEKIIYCDQTTFLSNAKPQRTWMHIDHPSLLTPLNYTQLKSISVYGSISNCHSRPQYMLGTATNIVQMKAFLIKLARSLQNPFMRAKPWLVLDNHSAHHSKKLKQTLNDHFRPLFMPAYSSPFNCQELVWAHVKRAYFVKLHRRDQNFASVEAFRDFVADVLKTTPIC